MRHDFVKICFVIKNAIIYCDKILPQFHGCTDEYSEIKVSEEGFNNVCFYAYGCFRKFSGLSSYNGTYLISSFIQQQK